MINTVLLDFDGTMMNTRDGIINSWKHLFKTIRGEDVTEEFLKDTFGEPLKTSLAKFFPDKPIEKCLKVYREYQEKNQGEMMVPFDGVVDVINALAENGCKIGLVTSRLDISAKKGLEKAGILKHFKSLITANVVDHHKPHPEPILKALDELGSKKEETIMVGDTIFDLQCAHNAGVKSVLVGWSEDILTLEEAGEYQPDYVIKEAKDLLKIVEV